jgi:hypothetical protein
MYLGIAKVMRSLVVSRSQARICQDKKKSTSMMSSSSASLLEDDDGGDDDADECLGMSWRRQKALPPPPQSWCRLWHHRRPQSWRRHKRHRRPQSWRRHKRHRRPSFHNYHSLNIKSATERTPCVCQRASPITTDKTSGTPKGVRGENTRFRRFAKDQVDVRLGMSHESHVAYTRSLWTCQMFLGFLDHDVYVAHATPFDAIFCSYGAKSHVAAMFFLKAMLTCMLGMHS